MPFEIVHKVRYFHWAQLFHMVHKSKTVCSVPTYLDSCTKSLLEDTWLPRLWKIRDHHHLGSYPFSAPSTSVFSQPEVIVPSSLRELTFFLNKEMTSEILVEILRILRYVEKQQQRIPRFSSSSSNVSFSPCGIELSR